MNTTTDAASAVSAVTARIETIESELAATRAALAEVEAGAAVAPPPARPDALTIEQVRKGWGIERSTVAEMVRRRDIRSVKIGRCRWVFRADQDAYIDTRRGAA